MWSCRCSSRRCRGASGENVSRRHLRSSGFPIARRICRTSYPAASSNASRLPATIIVADEPTGDLDRITAEEILALLERLHGELGKTIIMVTHDPKAAEKASRLVHLEKGVLVD